VNGRELTLYKEFSDSDGSVEVDVESPTFETIADL